MVRKKIGEKVNAAWLYLSLILALLILAAGCGGKDEKKVEPTPMPSESALPMDTELPLESESLSDPLAMNPPQPIAGDEMSAGDANIALATQEFSVVPNEMRTGPDEPLAQLPTAEPVISAPIEQTIEPLLTISPEESASIEPTILPTEPAALPTTDQKTPLPISPTGNPSPTPFPKAPKEIAPSAYMSYKQLVGDNGDYSMPHNVPSRDTYKILIDVTNQVMTVYNKKSGEIVRQMLCTTGKKDTPTPRGIKKMGKGRARFGFFKDYDCYAQYCTQVVQGIYIHSVLYREKDAKTLIKSSYRNLGRPSSHGCIRLSVPDARWIFYNIAPQTECEIKAMKKNDALRRSLRLASPPASKK